MKSFGEVKVVGLFGPGDQIGGESIDGMHGALIACTPDEAEEIGKLLYQIVSVRPIAGYTFWRIRNARGERVTDRGTLAECQELLRKYAGKFQAWSHGPYKILRVTRRPKATPPPQRGTEER